MISLLVKLLFVGIAIWLIAITIVVATSKSGTSGPGKTGPPGPEGPAGPPGTDGGGSVMTAYTPQIFTTGNMKKNTCQACYKLDGKFVKVWFNFLASTTANHPIVDMDISIPEYGDNVAKDWTLYNYSCSLNNATIDSNFLFTLSQALQNEASNTIKFTFGLFLKPDKNVPVNTPLLGYGWFIINLN